MKSKGKIQLFCYIHSLLHKMMLSIVESKSNKSMLSRDTFRCTQDKVVNLNLVESKNVENKNVEIKISKVKMSKSKNVEN